MRKDYGTHFAPDFVTECHAIGELAAVRRAFGIGWPRHGTLVDSEGVRSSRYALNVSEPRCALPQKKPKVDAVA